jgi:hypothetical protein
VLSSCEEGQAYGERAGAVQRAVLGELGRRAESQLPAGLRPPPLSLSGDEGQVSAYLKAWAEACPRPLVICFDEIDALQGESLVAVLRQLRAGFPWRPASFPASVVLCGLRDVRDYKAASGGDPSRLGTASPFNIKLESLRLGDFTGDEVRELYAQHTADTGQVFTEEALAAAFAATRGQPWLVNALAREIVDVMSVALSEPVTAAHVEEARERLILARATHLDSLVSKLHEPRVRRIVEPILAGTTATGDTAYDEDVAYCRDLGLLAPDNPLRVANPIYHEVLARVLAGSFEGNIVAEPRSFVLPDGRLDLRRVLRGFAAFWREHGEVLVSGGTYHEVAAQLVLMAFLQRVVNGGGFIDREYGVGRGRIDLLVRWPYRGEDGARVWQREALELKVWRDKAKDPLAKGLAQLDVYLDRIGLDTGVLVIFDRRAKAKSIEARTRFTRAVSPGGRKVRVLRG